MKVMLFANTDWYLYNFRLPLAMTLRDRGDEVILLSPAGDYVQRLTANGFRWIGLRMARGGGNPLAEFGTLLQVWRLYRAERPDLVHHFTPKSVLYGSLAARWSAIHSIVNSVTGLGYLFSGQGWWRNLVRFLASRLYRLASEGRRSSFRILKTGLHS